MAQVPRQLVAHPRPCCPLQGARVLAWEPETGRRVIFHPPSPGDSEESKICSQHVLLLLSLLLLSMSEGWERFVCPHSPSCSRVLTICFLLHLRKLRTCPRPAVCLETLSLYCHFIFNENATAPWWPSDKRCSGGSDVRFRSHIAALWKVLQIHSNIARCEFPERGSAFQITVSGISFVYQTWTSAAPESDSQRTPFLSSYPMWTITGSFSLRPMERGCDPWCCCSHIVAVRGRPKEFQKRQPGAPTLLNLCTSPRNSYV